MTGTATAKRRVLIGDDNADVLTALRLLLKGAGHAVVAADSPAGILEAASGGPFDLILIDLNYTLDTTSGREGLDLLTRLRSLHSSTPVLVMTAWGDVPLAVEAMRRGAADFVQKPWDNEHLLEALTHSMTTADRQQQAVARAQAVQQRLLHVRHEQQPGWEYAAGSVAAEDVGGDLFDFYTPVEGPCGLALGDVSGKGVASALLMAHLQASLRSHARQASVDAVAALTEVNRLFFEAAPNEYFATLFLAHYDANGPALRYVNCGHPAPLLLRREGNAEWLEPTATVLGLFARWTAKEECVPLQRGDTLVVFSDGVLEAIEDEEAMQNEISNLARQRRGLSVRGLVEELLGLVQQKSGSRLRDDATVAVGRVV